MPADLLDFEAAAPDTNSCAGSLDKASAGDHCRSEAAHHGIFATPRITWLMFVTWCRTIMFEMLELESS